ncbi:MAG: co-chaperone DjlA [Gammaproteobacteria bacterium]|nr:co-chaperone DjlA [Gammaproteobacteria bacterium]
MLIWGKVLGGLLGLLLLGTWGLLLGVLIGHQFDRGLERSLRAGFGTTGSWSPRADPRRIQDAFFRASFSAMGHIAKADGRVSEEEIRAARGVMYHMRLTPEQVQSAIEHFTVGKQPDFSLEQTIERFRQSCLGRRDLMRAFVEIQVQAAMAGGGVSQAEREILWQICRSLGLSRVDLAQIEALVRAQHAFQNRRADTPPSARDLNEAYQVLGVERSASEKEIKTAYRRLMNQHHPDKLVAKGLPEAMMDNARVRTREIRAAYEKIKKQRGIR